LFVRYCYISAFFGFMTLVNIMVHPSMTLSFYQQSMNLDESHPILYKISYAHTVISMILASFALLGIVFIWYGVIYLIAVEFHIIGLQFESFSLGELTDGAKWKTKIDEFKILIQQYQRLLR
jgi:hypothetical protein